MLTCLDTWITCWREDLDMRKSYKVRENSGGPNTLEVRIAINKPETDGKQKRFRTRCSMFKARLDSAETPPD